MPFNTCVNRAFLLGRVGSEPTRETISGQLVLYFRLSTTENIKKDSSTSKHTEWHNIKLPSELLDGNAGPEPGDLVYIQGKVQTRIVFEEGVKIYKTEILVINIEKLELSEEMSHSA